MSFAPEFSPAGIDLADPRQPVVIRDEFTFASTESGEIGELGWGFTNGTWNLVNPEDGHPGTCRRASTAVSGTVASSFPGGAVRRCPFASGRWPR